MRISLIHPSRGRPAKALEAYQQWLSSAKHPENIQHILSLDESDNKKEFYLEFVGQHGSIILSNNDCVVGATNEAARIATGDILIYLSDDFKCPKDWDIKICNRFIPGDPLPRLLKVHDDLQKFEAEVLTIPIMNMALYQKLGYFFNPLYKSMWVDADLFHVCHNNNWIVYAPDLIFPHEHYSTSKVSIDETYLRSAANWDQGLAVFNKRKIEGFKL